MKMRNKLGKSGFTMIELLVVLIIVAILVAVAAPLYLANVKRSRMSEAVATMGLLRQAMRDYFINHNTYFSIAEDTATPAIATGNIQKQPTTGVDIGVGAAQYFSNGSYFVTAGTGTPRVVANGSTRSGLFSTPPGAQDFLISVKGIRSFKCAGAAPNTAASTPESCATKADEVAGTTTAGITTGEYEAEMDNSGRIFVCYGSCGAGSGNWSAY
jgi:prepilin-type N-terminal cleavage/methylation domain-containing protein